MKKNLYYGYGFNSLGMERINKIKNAGFDGVFIALYETDKNYYADIPLIKEKLSIETLHLNVQKEINNLWLQGTDGDILVEKVIEEIGIAIKYKIDKVIMHLISSDTHPKPSEIGLFRLKQIANYCDKNNILLCIENQRDMEHLFYVFNNLDNKCLRFCFDTGHAHAFTHNIDEFPFEFFKKYLICLHLHDNYGDFDSHELPFYGNINWSKIINKIYQCNQNIELTLEIHPFAMEKMNITDEKVFLKKAYDTLVQIESFIKKD